ncbi:MAG: hypothetical protein ACJA2G_001696 [Cognaticolwellia sp.]|jgi:hypothetical protein
MRHKIWSKIPETDEEIKLALGLSSNIVFFYLADYRDAIPAAINNKTGHKNMACLLFIVKQ